MTSAFFGIILGHLVGDYVLQTDWMATNKIKNSFIGWLAHFVHTATYVASVTAVTLVIFDSKIFVTPMAQFLLFNSHFWFDKFSLGDWWMRVIKRGRGLKAIVLDVPPFAVLSDGTKVKLANDEMYATKLGFAISVYIVVDNSIHLVLMFLIARYLL